jgi:hypothetical protein
VIDPLTVGKAAAPLIGPATRAVRKLVNDRRREGLFRDLLVDALCQAALEIGRDQGLAALNGDVLREDAMQVAKSAHLAAQEEVRQSSVWKRVLLFVPNRLRRKKTDVTTMTQQSLVDAVRRWLTAGVNAPREEQLKPTAFWELLRENGDVVVDRAAEVFPQVLVTAAEGSSGRDQADERRRYAGELLDAIDRNNARVVKWRRAASVGALGAAATGGLAVADNLTDVRGLLPAAVATGALSLVTVLWMAVQARETPRWDEPWAFERVLDSVRDWALNVRCLPPSEASGLLDVLNTRLLPRLSAWEPPLLPAALMRLGDLLEDRVAERPSFSQQAFDAALNDIDRLLLRPGERRGSSVPVAATRQY